MKLLCILAVALVVCHAKKPKGLQHFDRKDLHADMQKLLTPESAFPEGETGCEKEDVKKCIRCVHAQAMKCAMKMHRNPTYLEKVAECEANDPTFADKDKAWQETSHRYHKSIGECVAADRPDSPVQDSLFMARKKRSLGAMLPSAGCEHESYGDTIDEMERCWADMRGHKDNCNRKIRTCPKLSLCHGMGSEPSNEADKEWWTYMKELRVTKDEAVFAHKKNIYICAGKADADTPDSELRERLIGSYNEE